MQLVITPDSGEEHLYWPLILRGVGLGLLFVPISTLSLSTLKGKSIGEGAAFTGMMPLGGSLVLRSSPLYRSIQSGTSCNLVSHLNSASSKSKNSTAQIGFMSKGYTENEALAKAYKAIEYKVMVQSSVLSYIDIFYILSIILILHSFHPLIKRKNQSC
jgi:DHA2 family multidrug resistance protein